MNESSAEEILDKLPESNLQTFLESTPPGRVYNVVDLAVNESESQGGNWMSVWRIAMPELLLFCESDRCNGVRTFMSFEKLPPELKGGRTNIFLTYSCRNCLNSEKIFALICEKSQGDSPDGLVLKLGEEPSFGPSIPARVITLIGPDRGLFLAGRRSENQGLGIGAFAYYRRVVENQKNRLISEIKRIAIRLGATEEEQAVYDAAVAETQFHKAVDSIKSVIPQSLLINGQNPLMLLHSALSEGLHVQTDASCLELATSVRVVLTELSERIGQALKDENELSEAVKRLSNPKWND